MKSVVICEKPSQADNLKAALGDRFGPILPAQGHLYTLADPEDYRPEWKDWRGFHLLRPERFKKVPTTDPDKGRQAQLDRKRRAIADAVRAAECVIIATDCDREGQVIGTEILDVLGYKGQRLRAIFNSEDPGSLREAFERLKPNSTYQALYEAGLAREQADQIYNLSLTRAATTAMVPDGVKKVLGVGRVRTPTLGIVCLREMAIRDFRPSTSFGLAVTVRTAGGSEVLLTWRPAKDAPILDRAVAAACESKLTGRTGALTVKSERKREAGPRPPDLSTLQKIAGAWGWPASKTMAVAQALYDEHKVITYVRAETRYLPEVAKPTAAPIVAGLRTVAPWSEAPEAPLHLRSGKAGVFHDAGLNGESHHAIIPNVKTIDGLAQIAAKFSADERRLFEVVANLFMQAVAADHVFDETKLALTVDGREFTARAVLTVSPGWRAYAPAADQPKAEGLVALSGEIASGETAEVIASSVTSSTTKPPERFNEGSLVMQMKNAAKYIKDPDLRSRLEDAKGIGTQATRDSVITGLKDQGLIQVKGGKIYSTPAGEALFTELYHAAPDMIDPGKTAVWEHRLDQVLAGALSADAFVTEVAADVDRLLKIIARTKSSAAFGVAKPSEKMVKAALAIQKATRSPPPPDFRISFAACKAYLDAHPRQLKEA